MPYIPLERTFQDLPETTRSPLENGRFGLGAGFGSKVSWSTLLESHRVLIMSEAGAGKTEECREQARRLWDEEHAAFFIELSGIATETLADYLIDDAQLERLERWKSAQNERAFFFLDSIDELRLTKHSFDRTLARFAKALNSHIGRACIVLTTRPIPLDQRIIRERLPVPEVEELAGEEAFARIATGVKPAAPKHSAPKWRFVELNPLSDTQMQLMAQRRGVENAAGLLSAINARHAHDYARRPLDFLELCSDWHVHGKIRAHRDQVDNSIRVNLLARSDRDEPAELSAQKAREGAGRIALAALLTRRLVIWHSTDGDRGATDNALDPAKILTDWSPIEVRTLLERPLFGFANYGRVRFHHRSVIDFLAAERLLAMSRANFSNKDLSLLLFTSTPEGEHLVKPSMRSVAAWLARDHDAARAGVLAREPIVLLLHGDPETLSGDTRHAALRRYVEAYGQGGWRGHSVPALQVERFASRDLEGVVGELLGQTIENPEVRETLLGLIGAGQMHANADLAHAIAIDQTGSATDRTYAVFALAALGDARLSDLLNQMGSGQGNWPDRSVRSVLVELFPESLSASQLIEILRRLKPKKRDFSGVGAHLPLIIERHSLTRETLAELTVCFSELVGSSLTWDPDSHRFKSPRHDLVGALSSVCVKCLGAGNTDDDLAAACGVAGLLQTREQSLARERRSLHDALDAADGAFRGRVFWAQSRLARPLLPTPQRKPFTRLLLMQDIGGFSLSTEKDLDWIAAASADQAGDPYERELALELAIDATHRLEDHDTWLERLCISVADHAALSTRIMEFATALAAPREVPAWQKKQAERDEAARRKQAKRIASWIEFCRELAKSDVPYDKERTWHTAYYLWNAIAQSSREEGNAGWGRSFLEQFFDLPTVERMRQLFSRAWRLTTPTLRSERPEAEKDHVEPQMRVGLMGIYAEAESLGWASRLSTEEAKLACRYVSYEYGGMPAWVDALAAAHADAVETILGGELSDELESSERGHVSSLHQLRNASDPVVALLLPRIRVWTQQALNHVTSSLAHLEMVGSTTALLLTHGNGDDLAFIRDAAIKRLENEVEDHALAFWLALLGRVDPAEFLDSIERLSNPIPPAASSPVVGWFGALFGHQATLDTSVFTGQPHLLLRLVRLVNMHVRVVDDTDYETGRSTGTRDHAEYARNVLLNALLADVGPGAWEAKRELAGDAEVTHYSERVLTLARERLAEEWDASIFTEDAVNRLELAFEVAPRNTSEMASLLDARLSDIQDMLTRDASAREWWATTRVERLLRREIARALEGLARGGYTINQEAVTGEEKETDIRLISTAADVQGVIELKVGDSDAYSVRKLRDALAVQLVGRYMKPGNRRAGALVITLAETRSWRHPDTKADITFEALIAMLDSEAQALMARMGNGAFARVYGLDLRSNRT